MPMGAIGIKHELLTLCISNVKEITAKITCLGIVYCILSGMPVAAIGLIQ
jgi:hypothetical protein